MFEDQKFIPMRYLIILIIFIFSFGIASAQGDRGETIADWADLIYKKVNNSTKQVWDLVKQKTDIIPKEAEKKAEEILEEAQKAVIQKTEEVKEEAKEEIKEQIKKGIKKVFWGTVKNAEEKVFNPLKIKIQEGSGLVRSFVVQLRNYLLDWIKG